MFLKTTWRNLIGVRLSRIGKLHNFNCRAIVTSNQNKIFYATLPIRISLVYTDIVMVPYNFKSLVEERKKGKSEIREWNFKIASIPCLLVSSILLWQGVVKKDEYTYDRQIDGPGQFFDRFNFGLFERMRQGNDNYKICVKIKIFRQTTLGSIKVQEVAAK